MSKGLFREISLEKITSPEQLDRLIKVTSPSSWIALLAVGCILASVITWGFMGSLPTITYGQGILLNNGKVFSVYNHISGQIIDVRFKVGDLVKKGDVLAKIELHQLVEEINTLQRTISRMQADNNSETSEYREKAQQLQELREELLEHSQIVSPIDGRILELNIHNGSVITPGDPLVVIDEYGEHIKLEAVVYVPVEQAGSVLPGMEVQVSPLIANKEEYGFMLGKVISVSDYPDTPQNMMDTLENENLVSMLTGEGAPLSVLIDLIPDEYTRSGHKWSSPKGANIIVHSGTLVESAIIIKREKPINKVIPMLNSSEH